MHAYIIKAYTHAHRPKSSIIKETDNKYRFDNNRKISFRRVGVRGLNDILSRVIHK